MVADGHITVQRLLCLADCALNKEYFLVNLFDRSAMTADSYVCRHDRIVTHDPSDTETMRGAKGDVYWPGLGDPFVVDMPLS